MALTIARDIGKRNLEAELLICIGNTLQLQGDNDEAERLLQASLVLGREIGDRRIEAFSDGWNSKYQREHSQ